MLLLEVLARRLFLALPVCGDRCLRQRWRPLSHHLLVVHHMIEHYSHALVAHVVLYLLGQLNFKLLQVVLVELLLLNEVTEVLADKYLNLN